MDDRSKMESDSFSIPESDWRDVGREAYRPLTRLNLAIGLALSEIEKKFPDVAIPAEASAPAALGAPAPAELALQMHEVAGEILSRAAGDEQSLRQIIGTLRTALAVCWDLYSVRESERTTVSEHMRNLRGRIEDFEQELRALRRSNARDDTRDDSSNDR